MLHQSPPFVKGQFLLGNLQQFKTDPLKALIAWQSEYGDILEFKIANRNFYVISHPDFVEQVFIRQSENFIKMYDAKKARGLSLVLGEGLVTSKGDLWRKQRRLMQPIFQRQQVSTMLEQMLVAGDNLLTKWKKLETGTEVNIAREMMGLTLEVITQTMFSTSVSNDLAKIAPALDTALHYAAMSTANPLTLPLFIPTPANQKFKQALNILDDVVYQIIEQHRLEPQKYNDLLSHLLNAQDSETGEKMSNKQLRDEVITIFTAGHETTANLLTWALYLLAKHPTVLKKLQQEIDDVLQKRLPCLEDLSQLCYTKAVLEETMRFRPPVGILLRKVVKDTVVSGYYLKQGHLIITNIYGLHHHKKLWKDSEVFNPERFLDTTKRKYYYIPFGVGERTCIGNHFALLESQLLLTMILQSYNLCLSFEKNVEMDMAVTIRPKGGLLMKLYPRT